MNTATVRKVMKEPFDELRANMKERQIGGSFNIYADSTILMVILNQIF